jgi:hypothetical protein
MCRFRAECVVCGYGVVCEYVRKDRVNRGLGDANDYDNVEFMVEFSRFCLHVELI